MGDWRGPKKVPHRFREHGLCVLLAEDCAEAAAFGRARLAQRRAAAIDARQHAPHHGALVDSHLVGALQCHLLLAVEQDQMLPAGGRGRGGIRCGGTAPYSRLCRIRSCTLCVGGGGSIGDAGHMAVNTMPTAPSNCDPQMVDWERGCMWDADQGLDGS